MELPVLLPLASGALAKPARRQPTSGRPPGRVAAPASPRTTRLAAPHPEGTRPPGMTQPPAGGPPATPPSPGPPESEPGPAIVIPCPVPGLPGSPVAGAAAAAEALTALLARAEEIYPSLVAARQSRRQVEFRAVAAGALPAVTLDAGAHVGREAAGNDEDLMLRGRLELGQKRGYRIQAARKEVEAARQRERQACVELSFLVRSGFAELQAAAAEESLARESVELARSLLRTAEIQFDAGAVPETDRLRAEVELENAEQALVAASAVTSARRAALNTVIGADPEAALEVPEIGLLPDPQRDLERLRELALRHPDIRAEQATLAARRAEIDVARTALQPDLVGSAAHGKIYDWPDGNVLRLGVEFPVFNFGRARPPRPASEPWSWETYQQAGGAAYPAGRYAEAEQLLRAALRKSRPVGPRDDRHIETQRALVSVLCVQRRVDETEALVKEALIAAESLPGPEGMEVALALNALANIHARQGRLPEAEARYRRSLAITERQLGRDDADVARVLGILAAVVDARGNAGEAVRLYHRALGIWEHRSGAESADAATALNNLADVYRSRGRNREAEPLFRRSLAIWERTLRPDHPGLAIGLSNLANVEQALGKNAAAETMMRRSIAMMRRSIAIMRRDLGVDHPDVAAALENYAHLLRLMWRDADAARAEAEREAIRARTRREPRQRETPTDNNSFGGTAA